MSDNVYMINSALKNKGYKEEVTWMQLSFCASLSGRVVDIGRVMWNIDNRYSFMTFALVETIAGNGKPEIALYLHTSESDTFLLSKIYGDVDVDDHEQINLDIIDEAVKIGALDDVTISSVFTSDGVR